MVINPFLTLSFSRVSQQPTEEIKREYLASLKKLQDEVSFNNFKLLRRLLYA